MASFEHTITGTTTKSEEGGGSASSSTSATSSSVTSPVIHDLTSHFVGITLEAAPEVSSSSSSTTASAGEIAATLHESSNSAISATEANKAAVRNTDSGSSSSSSGGGAAESSTANTKQEGWRSVRLVDPAETRPRGGASIIEIDGTLVTFGGTDREQQHFNDVSFLTDGLWVKKATKGDVPTVRSGHAVAAFGRMMFLFGGIDFAEEADYNDLYIFNIDTLTWSYVGEAGVEVKARNSHTMAVLHSSDVSCLVIYGGASSTEGPLGDTLFAVLPKDGSLGTEAGFITWNLLTGVGSNPGSREMHAFGYSGNAVYISGGRNIEGRLLGDMWRLSLETSPTDTANPAVLTWTDVSAHFGLPEPRCSHGMAVLANSTICIFGGFIGSSIGNDILQLDMKDMDPTVAAAVAKNQRWKKLTMSTVVTARFGLAMCPASAAAISSFRDGSYLTKTKPRTSKLETYTPPAQLRAAQRKANNAKLAANANADATNSNSSSSSSSADLNSASSSAAKEQTVSSVGFALFGGVSIDEDFGDIWICFCDI